MLYGQLLGSLQSMANGVLITGTSSSIPSPCGSNCSYTISFDGPWLDCNASVDNNAPWPENVSAFSAYWINTANPKSELLTVPYTPNSNSAFKVTTSVINDDTLLSQNTLHCVPSRAIYTINVSYVNSIQTMNVSGVFKEHLVNLWQVHNHRYPGIVVPEFFDASGYFGKIPAEWDNDTLTWYRDDNLLTLIAASASSLTGSFFAIEEMESTFSMGNKTYSKWAWVGSISGILFLYFWKVQRS